MQTAKFKNDITFPSGLVLFLGRKKRVITELVRLEIQREHMEWVNPETQSAEFISPRPVRERYLLFVNDKLFSTTTPSTTGRASMFVKKPIKKNAQVQIHLTMKYTELNEHQG